MGKQLCGDGGRGEGTKKYKQVVTEQLWDVKYYVGNGAAKELICITMDMNNGGGLPEGLRSAGWRGTKGEIKTTVIT